MLEFRAKRFIAICHAKELVLQPTSEELHGFISSLNFATVTFAPVYNCPHIQELRDKGIIKVTIDFLTR
jgi:hypothetical protein